MFEDEINTTASNNEKQTVLLLLIWWIYLQNLEESKIVDNFNLVRHERMLKGGEK